ncbi:MAG: hypothetical protein FD153_164 [Rhodospirillaceae bacterium]|nr:MAG: hypothetical protein FD153_164 [Rhodospirillaceae bacterium]
MVNDLVYDGKLIVYEQVTKRGVVHMGEVVRLPRQKRLAREQADAFRQMAFEFDLPDDMRAEIDNAIYRLTEEPGERWLFVKISPEQFRYVTRAIRECRNVATTLSVWTAAITYMRTDTGEILATREQLAADVDTLPCNVSTAMSDLARIGAILRHRRGRKVVYSINPTVGWNGGEGSRQAAVRKAPALRLVADGDNAS